MPHGRGRRQGGTPKRGVTTAICARDLDSSRLPGCKAGLAEEVAMFGVFARPKLDARFDATHAHSDEFAREVEVSGSLTVSNTGSDADVSGVELIIIAGFRRIALEVPAEWRTFRVAKGASKEGPVHWTLKLDSPLRAEAGQLYVSLLDQKRRKSEWRLPFTFEIR
jgi:hypothetical protein